MSKIIIIEVADNGYVVRIDGDGDVLLYKDFKGVVNCLQENLDIPNNEKIIVS